MIYMIYMTNTYVCSYFSKVGNEYSGAIKKAQKATFEI